MEILHRKCHLLSGNVNLRKGKFDYIIKSLFIVIIQQIIDIGLNIHPNS
jgi:hypothetical protein